MYALKSLIVLVSHAGHMGTFSILKNVIKCLHLPATSMLSRTKLFYVLPFWKSVHMSKMRAQNYKISLALKA